MESYLCQVLTPRKPPNPFPNNRWRGWQRDATLLAVTRARHRAQRLRGRDGSPNCSRTTAPCARGRGAASSKRSRASPERQSQGRPRSVRTLAATAPALACGNKYAKPTTQSLPVQSTCQAWLRPPGRHQSAQHRLQAFHRRSPTLSFQKVQETEGKTRLESQRPPPAGVHL